MSKKDLKNQHPDLNYNVIDVMSQIHPEGSSKYLTLLIKEYKIKNKEWCKNFYDDYNYYLETLKNWTNLNNEELSKIGYIDAKIMHELFNSITSIIDLESLKRHHEHHINNRLENPDISTYKSIQDLINEVKKADFKLINSEKRTFVHTVFEDEKWLVIKPLTFESSLKYGASTKWCTASKNNPYHFYRYTRNGNLYYLINKKDIYKCAMYFNTSENSKNVFELYNEEDDRTDTSILNIDRYVIKHIMEDSQNNKNNYQFISDTYPELIPELEKIINEQKVSEYYINTPNYVHDDEVPMTQAEQLLEELEMEAEHTMEVGNSLQNEYDSINEEIYEKRLSILEKQLKHSLNITWFSRLKRRIFGSKLIFVGLPKNMVPEYKEQEVLSKLHNTVLEWDIKYRCIFYMTSENNLVINKV